MINSIGSVDKNHYPERPDIWVVITDWVTGFSGREAQAEAVADMLKAPALWLKL
ncbi:MAG: hypothetical protein GWO38_24075 [Phycisphaerae bacterium]|nr:hypothetical protein [Phycisphaerae bacterium]NIP54623.1 hypothetical protein [Phycisphaerae bacterium]NIX30628.1 hypothetical protein [Phycisphaerae bacterium]